VRKFEPAIPVTKHVQKQPERTAVGTSDQRIMVSYRQLDALARSVMAQLSRLGLKRGNTVAVVSDNSVEFVLGFFAIVSSGARVAPLNPALTSTVRGQSKPASKGRN
jgi:acyl-CoA synthetase (AMP-forming)/AMP-acid ligase II